ncbi:hypothetical protein QAD02_011571 [Eretmocerus hayati]|uniref:Uncharacterized protein n=1 Tax=Eretmocerus hayati TaxID=131215 RepID=A0ACC2NX61_9HYME|nr:hypothetical protein QAD02_011571 [Eretmocerus hayati]
MKMSRSQYFRYGLILPKKNQLSAPKVGNVFGNDEDSEEEEGSDWVRKALKAENEKNKVKKQTKLNMQKALKEDPTIYQYDEVYDDIERTKEEAKSATKVERKSKYIGNLLKSAELRKKEQELRKDRMIQKEIEAEDAMFADKERFVTSSYKAKLEEMRKFEEEQENQDRLEAIGDVMKQKDMSGFYRHLYRQTVEKNDADLGIKSASEEPTKKILDNKLPVNIDEDDPIPSDSESDEDNSDEGTNKDLGKPTFSSKMKKARQYRKRVQEASESESEQELEKSQATEAPALEKLDESRETGLETPAKKQKVMDVCEKDNSEETKEKKDENSKESSPSAEVKEQPVESTDAAVVVKEKVKKVEKKKVNIWIKRTVGPVFDAALERYLIRKQERLAGS